jgi:hypothetical protein
MFDINSGCTSEMIATEDTAVPCPYPKIIMSAREEETAMPIGVNLSLKPLITIAFTSV